MKKIFSLALVLAAAIQVSAAHVAPESPVGVSVLKSGSVVKLFYRGEECGTVKVAIYNQKGHVVYREVLEDTEDFMRPYNFSALPSGKYTIELTDKFGTKSRSVEHGLRDNSMVVKLTRLSKNEHKYVLSVPDQGAESLVVRIYDRNNKMVYETTERVNGDFARMYNLNKIRGYHMIHVTDDKGHSNSIVN